MPDEQLAFPWGGQTGEPAVPAPLPGIAPLARRLRELAGRQVYLGCSSWKYPGWLGRVYDPGRYQSRGRFSRKKFDADCLGEYAAVFSTVCGDFAFYQFPSADMWARTLDPLPAGFRFALKVPDEVTVWRYPGLSRYGDRAGAVNPHFMDSGLLCERLLAPLEPYRDRLGPIIIQFGTFHEDPPKRVDDFAARLDGMLAGLPVERHLFAVEVRNRSFLHADSPYLGVLREHGVAHCLNSWTHMPPVAEQVQVPGVFTAPHAVARLLLRPGRTYRQAVAKFAPYERASDLYAEGRDTLGELIRSFTPGENALYAFVNNRFEGNAVETIESVVMPPT